MEEFFDIILMIISLIIMCLILSVFLSAIRSLPLSKDCPPLNIDRLEPIISTRWFCERR